MSTSRRRSPSRSWSSAVLVTGPHCAHQDSNGAIQVEAERCHSIDLSLSLGGKGSRITPSPPLPNKESSFGASDSDPDDNDNSNMHELADCEALTHIVPPPGDQEVSDGFDVCREYGYRYAYSKEEEEDDDDEDLALASRRSHPVPILPLGISFSSFVNPLEDSSSHEPPFVTHVLGKSYHPIHDYAPRRSDESSLFWFTYRCDFPEIVPYRITTDAGWGCMLRSAQMMLGQALRVHFQSREWRPPQSIAKRRLDPFMTRILTWFADFPSQAGCIFSLHNMVAAGLSRYQTLPGEWYGPGTACYVLRDLCQMHEKQQKQLQKQRSPSSGVQSSFVQVDLDRPIFRVYVASQGMIYRDAVQELMLRGVKQSQRSADTDGVHDNHLSHPLDPKYMREHDDAGQDLEWSSGLLMLIPLRLGLKSFNEDYSVPLAHMFSLPQSVGALGGRPRGARWFYGANSDGSKLYGLDPHTIQTAPHRKLVNTSRGGKACVVALTEEYIRSVHTSCPEAINFHRMDPSLSLGFYCRDRQDFERWCRSLQIWKQSHGTMPELFAVADAVPDYSANVSSVMNEMMLSTMSAADGCADSFTGDVLDNDGDMSDDDEYVML